MAHRARVLLATAGVAVWVASILYQRSGDDDDRRRFRPQGVLSTLAADPYTWQMPGRARPR